MSNESTAAVFTDSQYYRQHVASSIARSIEPVLQYVLRRPLFRNIRCVTDRPKMISTPEPATSTTNIDAPCTRATSVHAVSEWDIENICLCVRLCPHAKQQIYSCSNAYLDAGNCSSERAPAEKRNHPSVKHGRCQSHSPLCYTLE